MSHEQRSDAWFEDRKGKITASIAAGCLGLCPYTSRQKAWRTVLGMQASESNKHMTWGTEFEGTARNAYECETGQIVTEVGFVPHPSIAWLGASPDGLAGDGLVEIKCPTKLPEIVPIHHRIQMIVQLACTGRTWCDYYVWTHDGSFLRRVFPSGVNGILARLEAFYRDFVLTGVEPPRKKRRKAA
jgi:putative phage-type endonuclease